MPLPKQLSAWKSLLDDTLAKGRAKYGSSNYSLKRGMKEASKLYKKTKGKTSKMRGGKGSSLGIDKPIMGGEGDMESIKPPEMAGGEPTPIRPIRGGRRTRRRSTRRR